MRQLFFTLLICFATFSLFGQIEKPLHKPSKKSLGLSKVTAAPITTSLIGIPKAQRTILNSFVPRSLPPLKRNLDKNLGLRIIQTSKEGAPIMIKGNLKNTPSGRAISLQVYDYLEAIKSPIQIKVPQDEFVIIEQKTDDLGQTHFKLDQQYKGIKVYGGQIWLHAKTNKINLFNGRAFATPDLKNLQANISKEKAQIIANQDVIQYTRIKKLSQLEEKLIGNKLQPELVIYHTPTTRKAHLAWYLHLYPNVSNQWEYFIDAHTGRVLESFKNLCQLHHDIYKKEKEICWDNASTKANKIPVSDKKNLPNSPQNGPATAVATDLNNVNHTINSYEINGNFFLIDASRTMFNATRSQLPDDPIGAIWTIDAENTSPTNDDFGAKHVGNNNNTWNIRLPVSAHSNAGIAYEYFRNTFGRNSINGSGGTILSLINVSDEDGSSLANAFWNGSAMFYGNGGNAFFPLAGALDVAGHEMSHGVIQNTAGLRYQGESGAMNESFADIFGVLIDRDDWKLGEDVVNPNIFRSGALRDMQNPHNGGSSLQDNGWQPDNVTQQYRGSQDNGGVHINSGIVNKAFFNFASNVGKDKAEKVYFRALSTYLVNTSQFVDLRSSVIQSAIDLHGANSNEVAAAAAAFDQVGILGSNTGGGSQSGGAEDVDVEANPGNDFIVYTDDTKTNLYVADEQGNILVDPFSTSGVLSRPSITDDGTAIVFIAADKTMHLITIDWDNDGTFEEEVIQDEPIWRNVAVSRDGFRIAALKDEVINQVDVFDFTLEEWKIFELFNPTFTEGITTGDVQYADIIEFDFSSQFVIYDAFKTIRGDFGADDIEYWDIGFLKVYDTTMDNFEQDVNNNIFKLFSGLPENISIGNPTFSKNSPNILAFDYLDDFEGTNELRGVNLTTGDQETIFENSVLSFPSYSRLDDKIIFNFNNQGDNIVAQIGLSADKISAATDAFILVSQTAGANLGNWFSNGARQLTATNELEKSLLDLQVSPNPFANELVIQFSLKERKELIIEIYNTLGQRQISKELSAVNGANNFSVDTKNLPKGAYVVSLKSEKGIVSLKIVK